MPIMYRVTDPYEAVTLQRRLADARPIVKGFLAQARTDVTVERVRVPADADTICALYNGKREHVQLQRLAAWHGTKRGGLKPIPQDKWATWLD